MKSIESAFNGVILTLGIVLVILGVLSLLAPWASGLAVQATVGLLMFGAGIAWIDFSCHARSWNSGVWEALVGDLSVLNSDQWPLSGLWAVGTWVGVDLLFGGFSLIRIGLVGHRQD